MRRLLLSLLILSACSDSENAADQDADRNIANERPSPQPPAAGDWLEILPEGETSCARETSFRFFVRGGRSDRILIDFAGGGACWNQLTCSISDSLFRDQAPTLSDFLGEIENGALGGIFEPAPQGAFSDWTLIHIPYCTGDIHWGNALQDYGEGVTIQHRGYANASSALDWIYAHYAQPSNIFVSGCSAGAYGAALHSAYIAHHYQRAKLALLADSGAGIITDTFLNDSLPSWNAQGALPSFIPGLDWPLAELRLPDLYKAISAAFPRQRFAQTATQYDHDQVFFYTAMGGMAQDWPGLFRESLSTIERDAGNFRSYVPPGSMHCALPYPHFYTREVGAVRLADWTQQLVLGDSPPDSVACEGRECCDDAVCAACRGSSEGPCQFCTDWPPSWSECAMTAR